MEAIKLCRLDTPIIFIEARINLSRFVVTGCAAKTSATVTFPSLNLISLDRKSGSAGMPRPISYAVFCLKKKKHFQRHGDGEVPEGFGVLAEVSPGDRAVVRKSTRLNSS